MRLLPAILLVLACLCSTAFAQATNPISTSPTSSITGGTGCNTGVSTHIQKGNGAGGCSDAVSLTDYQPPIGGNTLAAHNFANSISAGGSLSGAQPLDADLSLSDIATNNVSTNNHGFAPKAPNDATKFLNGVGAYSVPSGVTSAVATAMATSYVETNYGGL